LSALSIPCIIWVDTTCSQSLIADGVTIHTQSGNSALQHEQDRNCAYGVTGASV
jgi:hypothetical protein